MNPKYKFACFLVLIFVAAFASGLYSSPLAPGGHLIVCGRDELFILDVCKDPPQKVWSWRAADRPELPEPIRSKFKTIDECKPVDGGARILITASSDGVAVIERTTGKALFYASVVNAHSIESLPQGRLVVAASHRADAPGDRLVLFDISRPDKPLFHTDLPSPHGVVWDAKRELLWAISSQELIGYKLANWDTPAPSLIRAVSYALPDTSGHDLYPVPGTSFLSLTTGRHCWRFDRDERKFSPHPEISDRRGAKCIDTNAATGQIVWTLSEGGNWWTDKLRFLRPETTLQIPGEEIYKARWFSFPEALASR